MSITSEIKHGGKISGDGSEAVKHYYVVWIKTPCYNLVNGYLILKERIFSLQP
jgi:hypothetical protein